MKSPKKNRLTQYACALHDPEANGKSPPKKEDENNAEQKKKLFDFLYRLKSDISRLATSTQQMRAQLAADRKSCARNTRIRESFYAKKRGSRNIHMNKKKEEGKIE